MSDKNPFKKTLSALLSYFPVTRNIAAYRVTLSQSYRQKCHGCVMGTWWLMPDTLSPCWRRGYLRLCVSGPVLCFVLRLRQSVRHFAEKIESLATTTMITNKKYRKLLYYNYKKKVRSFAIIAVCRHVFLLHTWYRAGISRAMSADYTCKW